MIKIFENDPEGYNHKINFVDHENNLVGYDLADDCCAHGGWFISLEIEEKEKDIPKEKVEYNLESYKFDSTFFKFIDAGDGYDDYSTVVFKLISEELPILYLHCYNVHNGYYSKGFTKSFGEIKEGKV